MEATTVQPSTNGSRRGRQVRVGIVGGGFGGLGMGARLKEEGFYDFTIFERGDSVGGVWRANTYPGAACDVPSHAYSFSFEPGHQWTRRYAPREDIMRYLDELADSYDLRGQIQLNTEVESASFDSETGTWTLKTSAGDEHTFDAIVTACGQLTNPSTPKLDGIENFEGTSFHSAEWNHDHDLSGRKVAVIGTGASAIQFVPEIAGGAAEVTVYQRSAPWILPKPDREYGAWEQKLFKHLPTRVAASRLMMLGVLELGALGFVGADSVMKPTGWIAERSRQKALEGRPDLLAKTEPGYDFGCKRVLFTSQWYETLRRDDVELVNAAGIERVGSNSITTNDGTEREADTIIYGTGFRSHDFVAPMKINGLDGLDLDDAWAERPEAYLGTTVTGFPNMFFLYGPNTNHGAASVPFLLECQFEYAIDAIRRLRGGVRYLDLRPEVQEAWIREIDERSQDTVWVGGGCSNWYIEDGKNTNNWVGGWMEYKRRTETLNPDDYQLVG